MEEASVVGKIIITGKLHLKSPLIIGSGKDDYADIEVLKDSEGKAFIPATSVIGVLRHYFYDNFTKNINEDIQQFWGFSEKIKSNGEEKQNSIQSAFVCHDLFTHDAKIIIRDGIRIDTKTQIVEDEAKYDYELVDKGAVFDLFWEVTLRQNHNSDNFKHVLATILQPLKSGTISFGAKTNSGFGKCTLEDVQVFEFDFSEKEDVLKWLKQDFSEGTSDLDFTAYPSEHTLFSIEANFAVKNSIIVRSYSGEVNMPDATSITSNGAFVLPGTSIKGAIRHRALKIIKTLYDDDEVAEKRINELFGIAGENVNDEKIKGRVLIEERKIKNVEPELQNRIKIDRFTSGTINTALFDSMPLWNKNENFESVTIVIKISKYKPWEAGLMLQVLKDLWCEDLAIGGEKNVGRGVLKGTSARIKWKGGEIVIRSKDKELELDEYSTSELNNFAQCFVKSIHEVA